MPEGGAQAPCGSMPSPPQTGVGGTMHDKCLMLGRAPRRTFSSPSVVRNTLRSPQMRTAASSSCPSSSPSAAAAPASAAASAAASRAPPPALPAMRLRAPRVPVWRGRQQSGESGKVHGRRWPTSEGMTCGTGEASSRLASTAGHGTGGMRARSEGAGLARCMAARRCLRVACSEAGPSRAGGAGRGSAPCRGTTGGGRTAGCPAEACGTRWRHCSAQAGSEPSPERGVLAAAGRQCRIRVHAAASRCQRLERRSRRGAAARHASART